MREKGTAYESLALSHLQKAGLTLLARNYTCRLGEIDLVMREKQSVVFIEVRYRKSAEHGTGAATIGATKRTKLIRTAKLYLQEHPRLATSTCRFDAVTISGDMEAPDIRWLRSVFDAYS